MPSKPSSSANRARAATSLQGIRCWATSKPNLIAAPSAEWRVRSFLALAVHEEIDSLVEERDVTGDALALRQRRTVRPDDILLKFVADARRPVLGSALVGAVR